MMLFCHMAHVTLSLYGKKLVCTLSRETMAWQRYLNCGLGGHPDQVSARASQESPQPWARVTPIKMSLWSTFQMEGGTAQDYGICYGVQEKNILGLQDLRYNV